MHIAAYRCPVQHGVAHEWLAAPRTSRAHLLAVCALHRGRNCRRGDTGRSLRAATGYALRPSGARHAPELPCRNAPAPHPPRPRARRLLPLPWSADRRSAARRARPPPRPSALTCSVGFARVRTRFCLSLKVVQLVYPELGLVRLARPCKPHSRAVFGRPNLHEIAELVREPHASAVYLLSKRA